MRFRSRAQYSILIGTVSSALPHISDIDVSKNEQDRLATVAVDADRINHNLDQFAGPHQLAPVLKSNAYGHGLELVAEAVSNRSDVPFVSLAAYREVQRLRASEISLPALIIGYTPATTICGNELTDVHFTLSSLEQLERLADTLKKPQTFHLKVETGMHRYGVKPDDLQTAFSLIESNPNIQLVGAFSHFSDAYESESQHTKTQIKRWNQAAERIQNHFDVSYLHMAATSGHFYRQAVTANLERVGIGLYGITSYASNLSVKPALSLQTFVAVVKEVSAGQPIGYNQSFTADEGMTIAVLPIGYQEGVDRRLSNTGVVKVKDNVCPIIGCVSMNATMIDVSDVDNIGVGDRVVVYGKEQDQPHSVLNQAQTADTIPYDILTGLSPELHRKTTNQ